MDINTHIMRLLESIRRGKYLVIRPNPSSEIGELEVLAFNNKFEVESYLNGCSNPEDCVPAMRLDLEYKIRCKRKV